MLLFRPIWLLTKKDIRLEFRNKSLIGGLLLYIAATIFVSYLSFTQVAEVPVWNALLWIILLFSFTNSIAASFQFEKDGRDIYLYTLVSPQQIILSKILFNSILGVLTSVLTYLVYQLLLGDLVQDHLLFLVTLIFGAFGFSAALSLIGAIAVRTGNNLSIMSILGFPIILPILITLMRLSKNAIDGLAWSVSYKYMAVLVALNVIVVTLSYLLFPYLWRE